MLGLDDLPRGLRIYLVAVMLIGPAVAVTTAVAGSSPFDHRHLLAAAMLVMLAVIAERYPLHLTHQTTVNVASAAYFAMLLVFPLGAPGLLAMLGIIGGHVLRRADPAETLFNIGQGALYVTCGALTFAALRGGAGPAWANSLDITFAAVAAALVMHVVNTGLVTLAAALQLGRNPVRVWWRTLADDLPAHVALTAVGVVTAYIAAGEPLLLPALALPVALVHYSVGRLVQLRSDTVEALASLVDIIELRDPYTAGHSRRVAATARAVALRLGLTAEEADFLESAGRVHDLGKVAIDPLVLAKPGRLDANEWNEMQQHPAHGATVISRFNAWHGGVSLIRHHHERWDGQGYPDGLAGEDIPLGARILAVADTWDALTSDRPYRNGMSHDTATRILREGAGVQWDPRVVGALLEHLADLTLPATQRVPDLTGSGTAPAHVSVPRIAPLLSGEGPG